MKLFKIFVGQGPQELEKKLNAWVERDPDAEIVDVRFSATLAPDNAPDYLYALVLYE